MLCAFPVVDAKGVRSARGRGRGAWLVLISSSSELRRRQNLPIDETRRDESETRVRRAFDLGGGAPFIYPSHPSLFYP